ncbi:hypothetical protein M8C21_004046 [Ambrosia artemisiifolia]|uniref:SPRY domain-containing protein n=1 Tax=Ambrosia artemisiifolia TaxID=4212 RepID=A0AAD5CBC4_AMBAR|nr:hypothetical protein M8C21_004046 [Ambrosia artemisiifolia]
MHGGPLIAVVVASTGIFLLILFYLTRFFCYHTKTQQQQQPIQRATSIQNGIVKLHQQQNMLSNNTNNKRRTNYYVLRRGMSSKVLFNWSDNPTLVTEAVENGWSRFAFTAFASSPSVSKNSVFGYCGPTGDGTGNKPVETGWEVCEGSTEFVQIIRFNSGRTGSGTMAVVKSALPLPGPALNTSAFPQDAYFEITILSLFEDEITGLSLGVNSEGEKIKLIENNQGKVSSESLVHVKSTGGGFGKGEELKGWSGGKDIVEGVKVEKLGVVLSVGFAGGGSMPVKVPGSYPGSIGFNSDGSIYLEGVKLTNELESEEWGKVEKVIGCGYNPSQRKVYFTVDSKLVREVYCMTEEFETPLYPVLAANSNVTVLVNFGQSVFKYTQANLHRTPNPCFVGQSASSPIIGSEDSRELFSMGRIDAHWLDRSTKRNAQYFGSVNRGMSDYDEFSEGDLFEIVLDNNSRGRSPSIHY